MSEPKLLSAETAKQYVEWLRQRAQKFGADDPTADQIARVLSRHIAALAAERDALMDRMRTMVKHFRTTRGSGYIQKKPFFPMVTFRDGMDFAADELAAALEQPKEEADHE